MYRLRGSVHGDDAINLFGFYKEKAIELEGAEQYFMAAIALVWLYICPSFGVTRITDHKGARPQ